MEVALRRQLAPLVLTDRRFAVAVAHRRAGKTVAAVQRLILRAMSCPRPDARAAYIAPTYGQAKRAAWDYLKRLSASVQTKAHETELTVSLVNGARISLYGADNPDTLRGIYLDDVVLDEYADMAPRVWPEIVRPALSDRRGSALFIGTPKGRNDFWLRYDAAQRDPEWAAVMLKASETGLLPADELEAARKAMTPDQYAQEYECSFDAAVIGSYYGKLLDEAQTEGRITRVPHEPAKQVETWWDLGVGDSTAIWFAQRVRDEVRLIDYYEMTGEGLPHYAKVLQAKPYIYSRHVAPHDIAVRELGSGRSRLEMAAGLGISFEVAPNLPVDDGIGAVRLMLPKCWFDDEKCAAALEALRQYRKDYDERLKVFRDRPRHDWTSHCADAFRMGAVAWQEQRERMKAPLRGPMRGPSGWMGL